MEDVLGIIAFIASCIIGIIILAIFHSIFDVTYLGCGAILTEIFVCWMLGFGIVMWIGEGILMLWPIIKWILIIGIPIFVIFLVCNYNDDKQVESNKEAKPEDMNVELTWEPIYENDEIIAYKAITTITNNGDVDLTGYAIGLDAVLKDNTKKRYYINEKDPVLANSKLQRNVRISEKDIIDITNVHWAKFNGKLIENTNE